MSSDRGRIAVVVPTRDRLGALGRCLDGLAAQTIEELDVVVVDDGSTEASAVAAVVATLPGARLLRLSGRGPAAARNAGVRAATDAEVVLFVDDDCVPDPDWASCLSAAIAGGADAAGGSTVAAPDAATPSRASQTISNFVAARSTALDGTATFAATNNLGVRAEALAAVPFDETYRSAAGEDRDWSARLLAGGFRLVREPAARVTHHHELTAARFARKQFGYGRAAYRFGRGQREWTARREPLEFYVSLVRRGFAAGPVTGLYVLASQALVVAGYAAERRASRR